MARQIIINGVIVPEGANLEVSINSYRLPTRTFIDIPAHVYRAEKDGPVVLFMAGMHGDETNGIEIIRRLIREQYLSKLICGTVIAIPIINVVSFLYNSRELPDGKDLNRLFPGTKSGSIGSRIAHDLVSEILPMIDFGVDFHTGGAQITNYPQIRCVLNDHDNLDIAKQFGAPFIINSPYRDKSFRKEAAKKGKSILVYEAGESFRINPLAIAEGVSGCLRLLQNLGMANGVCSIQESKILRDSSWLRSKSSGIFWSYKKYGSLVHKGESIGHVADPYGETQQEIIAPSDGYIIGVNNRPIVNAGDALIHLGVM